MVYAAAPSPAAALKERSIADTGTPPPNGREQLEAQVAGQKLGLRTQNLLAIVLIGLVGMLLWMVWESAQILMQRDIADRYRMATDVQAEFAAVRQEHRALLLRLEQYHEAVLARQSDVTQLLLRVLPSLELQLRAPSEPEELPLCTLPPWCPKPPPLPPPR